ncbi:hypothetical protein FQV39_04555 [Bosea sp. F3-2]|uniref:hypothetical protein n=1 Tax=Bosea sp. F3-2 TaxID=2599640 RepID=UPI0011ED24BE|nr:hypothetical protein [Bosea sp. F3-2]QEL21930.1 hypothetical protein FQV39_04555 [Bosea sp. F3-2]
MHTTLYTLFMPPQDCFGDFGLLCGFTATPQVLGQIRRIFTGEMARPALAAFIHPTVNAVSDVPGLAWIWMRLRDRGYNLLHAKVALLGFRRRASDGYIIRLAVSTGNWTQDPLTDSIDLFWSIDVDPARPDLQDVADLRAAWAMFEWLRGRADCALIDRDYDGQRPDTRLAAAVDSLPASTQRPRFIDSRTQALAPQVIARLGSSRKGNRLILGSGYFETKGDGGAGLPERLRQALLRDKALTKDAELDLFLNPASCQSLAARAQALTDAGWKLRQPVSMVHSQDARLHAKFVLLASGEQEITGRLYLGSGNLSRAGFETAADAGGNLEAGVILDLPKGLTWRRRDGIRSLLPVQFNETVKLGTLLPGEDFERPEEPASLPPVSWLFWQDGTLSAPENALLAVIGPDGAPRNTPCDWPAPAPAVVTLAVGGWRLPVIAEGVLVVPRQPEMTVEDVLAGLGSFPEPPDRDQPADGPEGGEPLADASDSPEAPPATYAIRRMMHLLVRLGETQARIDPRDWQRWCRELRQNLDAIAPQEQAMIGFFRHALANPLPVLADPRMCPDGADESLLEAALTEAAKEWQLGDCPSLWAATAV